MKKVKVDFTLRAQSRKGQVTRYDLNVILKDIDANQKVFGKNFANIEVQPAKPLDMGDYQLICNERNIGDLMQNSKGIRVNDCDAEVGIGTFTETGDKYYFVRVQLSESVYRTCYLSQSQILNLKYVNLGYTFDETDETESIEKVEEDVKPRKKPIIEEA